MIFNIKGQLMKELEVNEYSGQIEIINNWNSGTYFVNFIYKEVSHQEILVKLQPALKASSIILMQDNTGRVCLAAPEVDVNSQFYIGSVSKHIAVYMLLVTMQEIYPGKNLDLLLIDFKENPKRYVHFSVFGKKDKSKK